MPLLTYSNLFGRHINSFHLTEIVSPPPNYCSTQFTKTSHIMNNCLQCRSQSSLELGMLMLMMPCNKLFTFNCLWASLCIFENQDPLLYLWPLQASIIQKNGFIFFYMYRVTWSVIIVTVIFLFCF